MNYLLTAILVVNILAIVLFAIFLRQCASVYTDFVDFVSPKGENPSDLALLVTQASETAGRVISMQVKTTLMGVSSGINRSVDSAVDDGIVEGVTGINPFVGSALGALGKRSRSKWLNNPLVMALLPQLLHLGQTGGNHNNSQSTGASSQVKFKL